MAPVGWHSVTTAAATIHRALASCLEQFQASSFCPRNVHCNPVGLFATSTRVLRQPSPGCLWASPCGRSHPLQTRPHCRDRRDRGFQGCLEAHAPFATSSWPLTPTLTTAANTLFSHGSWGACSFCPYLLLAWRTPTSTPTLTYPYSRVRLGGRPHQCQRSPIPTPASGLEGAHINANTHVITTPSMGLHA